MKIYQVHESGGEWEDSYDCIVKSCLEKEKAEEYKKQYEEVLEEILKNSGICNECPLCSGCGSIITAEELTDYCKRVVVDDFKIENGEVVECEKYEFVYNDDTSYEIVEVDVEE